MSSRDNVASPPLYTDKREGGGGQQKEGEDLKLGGDIGLDR